ncbi:MAG: efflux RND transporter periplasmic adaptor subunit [Betaproteobacteria bacterium]|nr:efflux RND transporter periplasmic adaptor subunit [Betaproteobacteria bacterium]
MQHFQKHSQLFARPLLAFLAMLAILPAGCGDKSPTPTVKDVITKNADKEVPGKADAHGKDDKGHEEGTIKLSEDEVKLAGVRVELIQEQEVADQLVVTATIQANQDRLAHLAPRVPGRIVKVNANLGDRIAAGQVLASLDSIEVGEARSAYAQAASEAEVAKSSLTRAERLQAEQIVSQKDFLRAKAEHNKAQAAVRAAGDKLQMLGVATKSDNVSVFPLTAPFAGTIIEKKAVLGELAQPDKSLFAIADLSVLWIEANLAEKDLPRIKVGDVAMITVAAYPNDRISGKLTYIGGMLEKETRTIRGRIEVKNTDGRLKPEMFATAAIQTSTKTKAFVLPDEAVVLISGQPTVFIEEHGGFEPRVVQLGERLQGRVIVKSGMKVDDLVVVAGTYALKARALKSQIGEGHAH